MSHRRRSSAVAWLPALVLAAACQPAPEPEAPPPAVRVDNAELGVAIAALPEIFRVARNAGSEIELELKEGEGRLLIAAGEPEQGVNLVAAVEEHQQSILERPGGDYKGGRELVVPSIPGAAYYSRGRYQSGEATAEETVVLLVHPRGDRQLRATYTYPAGDDTASRLENELFAVVGELEGLPAPEDETSESP